MSDELKALQDTAEQARAKALELKTALTDDSSDEERQAAEEAEKAALDAETAFANAKAKADEEAAGQGESGTGAGTGAADAAEPNAGDACVCPDGRKGTVHKFDDGLACIPNEDQSE